MNTQGHSERSEESLAPKQNIVIIRIPDASLPRLRLGESSRRAVETGLSMTAIIELCAMAKKGKYVYEWPRLMVTADAIIFGFFKGGVKLLLVKRAKDPFKGMWALPGGFVELDEELEDAAARELAEETHLVGVPLQQLHTFGKCGRDPRGRMITVAFMGIASNGLNKIKAGDDAGKARWFDIEKLPENLAFDHDEVTKFAIRKLKRKKSYRQHVSRNQK
jgi:8-oxo-dGTP diphosphatase